MKRNMGRQGGFALLVVLWTISLLALLVSALLVSSRNSLKLAATAHGSVIAEAAADGAVQRAIFLSLAGSLPPDGEARVVSIGQARVRLRVADEGQRINPNLSSPPLLAALLVAVGLPPAPALVLAQHIVDWRTGTPYAISGGLKVDAYQKAGLPYTTPNRPFLSVEEIGQVVGMTPAIMARIAPYLSVFQTGDPRLAAGRGSGVDAATASPGNAASIVQLAQMMNHGSVLAGFESATDVVSITADASAPGGARFIRTAVVRLSRPAPDDSAGGSGHWAILDWR